MKAGLLVLMSFSPLFFFGCGGNDDTVGPPPESELDLYINEFMASNHEAYADEFDEFDDWLEVFNNSDQAIDLGGTYVTDNLGNLTRYRIPTDNAEVTTIPAGGFAVIWADRQPGQGPLHTNFALSAGGESIALVDTDGVSIIDQVTYTAQSTDTSYARMPDGSDTWQFLATPTPGASNAAADR